MSIKKYTLKEEILKRKIKFVAFKKLSGYLSWRTKKNQITMQRENTENLNVPTALENENPILTDLFFAIKATTDSHGYCLKSNDFLAREISTGKRTLIRRLNDLENTGLILKEGRGLGRTIQITR